jgi:protocatechuate 3,4-dioxygenase beta subunit
MNRDHRLKALVATILCMSMATSMLVMMPGTADAAPTDGWIEGTVSDGLNPIPNALVIYILNAMGGGIPLGSTWTDSSGYYNLTVTGGLSYMVIVFQGDFYSASGMTSVTVGDASTVDIVMTPIAPAVADVTLHGFVTDEFGNPVTVGDMIGYSNDPNATGGGPPYYGNATAPDGLGQYSINVLASTQGGGAAIMNVPGHGFADNSTTTAFVSGGSYWINISFEVQVSTDDAVVSGSVTDANTGLPIDNVLVSMESRNQWNENESGYSNFTFTDASGFYEMNVTNGTANVMFSKVGYSMYRYEDIQIDHNVSLVLDAQLYAATATVRGNVTDGDTGLPIANAQVYESDMNGNFTMTYTDSSGHYVLDAFAGTMVMLAAQANGYGRSINLMNISDGDNIWHDFSMYGANSWLTGTVTDSITGMPIENADVFIWTFGESAWTKTDASGVYNLTNLVVGLYNININAMNYSSFNGGVNIVSGGNLYDAQLVPWNIPQTCRLWGYVTDDQTSAPIAGANVEIGQGAPEYNNNNRTSTDPSGYYEMWVPPIPLVYVVTARNYTHVEGMVNASNETSVQLDASLVPDLWSPNITFDQSPQENVSWTNPRWTRLSSH